MKDASLAKPAGSPPTVRSCNVPAEPEDPTHRPLKPFLLLCTIVALMGGGLIVYARTVAFVWDEGFHLLAAQLILRGKKPYLDFCFPQTPLNAYFNAAWMRIFGQSWRAVHVLATLALIGAILLTADFILVRCPVRRWRLPGAFAAAFLLAANRSVVEFATVGQAYAICMFLSVAAFRVSIAAVEREGLLLPLAAGLLTGASAACSLLTAAAAPVLLVWILYYSRAGSRVARSSAFVAGAVIPFVPVLWLFVQAPRQVFFNIVQYQAIYRRVNWGSATQQDLGVALSWVDSTSPLVMVVLITASLFFMVKKSGWSASQRAGFYLCGWLALAMSAELMTAHPTFTRYFIVAAPFFAILAVPGLYAIDWQIFNPDQPMWPMLMLACLLSLGVTKGLYDHRDSTTWKDTEKVAKKVDEVTPAGGSLLAEELVYFVTRRPPPAGMEFSYSHQIALPPAKAAPLHILSNADITRLVAARAYVTAESCDSNVIDALKLAPMYVHKEEIGDCTVFWDLVPGK